MTLERITRPREVEISWEIDGHSLSSVIDVLTEYKDKYPDAKLALYPYEEWGANRVDVEISYTEIESDEEYELRVGKIKKKEEEHLKRERAEYERLKKKFGE
jgi:hypothetical protein